MKSIRIALAALLIPIAAEAQNVDSLSADSAFRRSDWKATVEKYRRIAQSSPNLGMAWMRLGIAQQALGNVDDAIAALEKAHALNWQVPTAKLRLARLYAAKHNYDKSFAYLDQVVPLGAVAAPVLDTMSEFSGVRADARFRSVIDRITALRYPCRSQPDALAFDFWIGDWDVSPFNVPVAQAPIIGTNHVEPILEHCVLMENWTGRGAGGPSFGKSMNFWDTNRRQWRQVWVADGGGSLDYAGSFKDGAMRFEGWTLTPNGQRLLQKLTFFPIHRDTVRQLFESSADSGRTWTPGFDGRYVRRR